MLRYHNKQEPLRMQRKQRSGIQAEYKRQHRIQRKQRSGEAEYKRQQVIQPAAYPERKLRRIVCWLLILSAEIWKIYSPDCASTGSFALCPTFGLSEDERKQSTSPNAIRIVLHRWKKAGKIEKVEGLAKYRQLKRAMSKRYKRYKRYTF